jgi:2-oxoglutarate ferredoxin oxidoreductase subunit beta
MAIAAGASFVARGFAGDVEHLSRLIKIGIIHKGFALIDILQPCVSFNHKNTYSWYRERVYKLDTEVNYDTSDKLAAFGKAQEWDERIPIGVIYRKESATFEEQLPALNKVPLVRQAMEPGRVETLLAEFL